MSRIVVVLLCVGAALAQLKVKPPGWEELYKSRYVESESCHTVAGGVYNLLATGDDTSFTKEIKAFSAKDANDHLWDPSDLCSGKPEVLFIANGVYSKIPEFDHYFAIQTFGEQGQYAMLYQGFCGKAGKDEKGDPKPVRQKKWYKGTMWMDVITPHFAGQVANRADQNFVPSLGRDLPMSCADLSKLLVDSTKANGNPIKATYNYLFAPPGDKLRHVDDDAYEGYMWARHFVAEGDRMKYNVVNRAFTLKNLKHPAFSELSSQLVVSARDLKQRIRRSRNRNRAT